MQRELVGRDAVACLERSVTPSGAEEERREGHPAGLFAIPNEFTRIGLDIELMSILVRGKDPRTTRIYYLINPKRY